MVEVSLTVGKLDASLALLLTKEHHLIEFPTILLPPDVEAGSIVKISCERDHKMEKVDNATFTGIQDELLASFGTEYPKTPELRVRNVTQTSVVLEWDSIDIGTTDMISLTLYKNGTRFGVIPTPLKRTATKLSGLAIDTNYSFYLVLSTTGGTFKSEEINVKTHKMTDLTGITICVGDLDGTDITRANLEETVKKIGAKPLQDTVKLDTTHFICTVGEGPHWKRAQDLNIPIVRPEWIEACEAERRLVGVRAYYLTADPKLRPPVHRPRASSYGTSSLATANGVESSAASAINSTHNGSSPAGTAANSAGPASPNGPNSSSSHGLPPVNTTRHQRAVSEIQDSPISTPIVATTPSVEPLAEETEAEAEAAAADDYKEEEVAAEETPAPTTLSPSPPLVPASSDLAEVEATESLSTEEPAAPASEPEPAAEEPEAPVAATPTIQVTPPEETEAKLEEKTEESAKEDDEGLDDVPLEEEPRIDEKKAEETPVKEEEEAPKKSAVEKDEN